ncbi:MAG: DUF2344 domain-containing protein [Chloroflexi bacterium]|nr:DUF2344 domain-containing protein [Chloroflexota bacterium]
MQRLRLKFNRGDEIKFISHLDMMRLWQRVFIRAGIPLAYSEGFNPHPRMALAVPLALGVTSEVELMDIWCTRWVSPHWFTSALERQLPPGVKLSGVYPIAPTLPSLQSQVRFIEYRVEVIDKRNRQEVEAAIDRLLSSEELPWQHRRDTGPRTYDLRALVEDVWLIEERNGCYTLGMSLVSSEKGSGRPEQVAAALGFAGHPVSIHRTRLIMQTS